MVLTCCAYSCKERFKKGGSVTFHSFPKDPTRRKLWEVKLKRPDFQSTTFSKVCSKHFTSDCFNTARFGGTWLKSDAIPTLFDFHEEKLSKKRRSKKSPKKREVPSEENLYGQLISFEERLCEQVMYSDENVHIQLMSPDENLQERMISSDEHLQEQVISSNEHLKERVISPDKNVHERVISAKDEDLPASSQSPKKRLSYIGDFSMTDVLSPTNAQKLLRIFRAESSNYKKTIRGLRKENKRLKKRAEYLSSQLREWKGTRTSELNKELINKRITNRKSSKLKHPSSVFLTNELKSHKSGAASNGNSLSPDSNDNEKDNNDKKVKLDNTQTVSRVVYVASSAKEPGIIDLGISLEQGTNVLFFKSKNQLPER